MPNLPLSDLHEPESVVVQPEQPVVVQPEHPVDVSVQPLPLEHAPPQSQVETAFYLAQPAEKCR